MPPLGRALEVFAVCPAVMAASEHIKKLSQPGTLGNEIRRQETGTWVFVSL